VRQVVPMAGMGVSVNPDDELVTYALGSCLGVVVHDPEAHVGGLLHAMLPLSSSDPEKAAQNAALFVDTGVPALFRACYERGARKERMVVRVAGGASLTPAEEDDLFQIGTRNMVVLRKLLWKNGVLLRAQDVGGRLSRTVSLCVGSGQVMVKSSGNVYELD
jgi:chemotaxis protein CheD